MKRNNWAAAKWRNFLLISPTARLRFLRIKAAGSFFSLNLLFLLAACSPHGRLEAAGFSDLSEESPKVAAASPASKEDDPNLRGGFADSFSAPAPDDLRQSLEQDLQQYVGHPLAELSPQFDSPAVRMKTAQGVFVRYTAKTGLEVQVFSYGAPSIIQAIRVYDPQGFRWRFESSGN